MKPNKSLPLTLLTLTLISFQIGCTQSGFSASSGLSVSRESSNAAPSPEVAPEIPAPSAQPAPTPQPAPQPQPQPAPMPTPIPAPAPAPAPAPVSQLSVGQLIDDMTKPHESTAHGVNPDWGWGTRPRLGVGLDIPASFDDPHFTPWGIVANATSGSSARNTRVQIRKMILDVKRNGIWTRMVYNTNDSQLMGSLYTNYETNANVPANLRKHGTDGISVKIPDSGGSFHFMTTDRFRFARGAQEIIVRLEARLIVDDPTKADDRANARLLALSGGDIWKNATQAWNPNVLSNVDFAIGRFKYVTNDWMIFTSHTFATANEAQDYLSKESSLKAP